MGMVHQSIKSLLLNDSRVIKQPIWFQVQGVQQQVDQFLDTKNECKLFYKSYYSKANCVGLKPAWNAYLHLAIAHSGF